MNYNITATKCFSGIDPYGLLLINIILDRGINIIWDLDNIEFCPSKYWIKLLEEIKNPSGYHVSICGSENSNWKIYNTVDHVKIISNINIEIPINESIPMIEDIIKNIIELESWVLEQTEK